MWYYGDEELEETPIQTSSTKLPASTTVDQVKISELTLADLGPPEHSLSKNVHAITPRSRGESFDEDPLFDMDLDGEKLRPLLTQPHISKSHGASTYTSSQSSKHKKFSSVDIARMNKEKEYILELLQKYTCADLVPESGKTVVFDTELSVISALSALDENHIKSAPLWDSKHQDFVGMMTATDIIEILLASFKMESLGNTFSLLKRHRIKSWRGNNNNNNNINFFIILEILPDSTSPSLKSQLISIDPEETLHIASKTLLKYKIHRLPVLDPESNTILHILTHYRIMVFVMQQVKRLNE